MEKVKDIASKVKGTGSKLPTRQLGKNGPQVTAFGFGLMGLSAFYGKPKPDEEQFKVLDAAYDRGELNWDSADMYMDNEDLLGKWFKANPGKREKIFLATNFANRRTPEGKVEVSSSPEYCKQACDKSLSRLGVTHIDLYYCHRLNKNTPIEDTVRAMAELKREGKIKYLGLSECSSESLRRACKIEHISAVQISSTRPSPSTSNRPTNNLLKPCRELGVAVVCYSPIGRGMITGLIRSPDDFEEGRLPRRCRPASAQRTSPRTSSSSTRSTPSRRRRGCTASQLTLAWLMAQGNDIVPIPGTTKIERLDENLGALNIKLSSEAEKTISQACENAEVPGARYPEAMAGALFVTTVPAAAKGGTVLVK